MKPVFSSVLALVLSILCSTTTVYSQSEAKPSSELVKIDTRAGVTQKFILLKPANPVASVILFAGGHGNLKLSKFFGKIAMDWGSKNFLVRTREDFARHGFMVAVVDAPSDQNWKRGLIVSKKKKEIFRMNKDHAQDIKAVAAYLRNKSKLPVWLVGTSMGTLSAANGAIRIKEGIDGLVLTSTMTRAKPDWSKGFKKDYRQGVLTMGLDKIILPTLIVSHRDDGCLATPAGDAPKIKEGLVNSKKVEIRSFTGGKRPLSDPCEALSEHGFYGIEEQVVSAIADFIKSNSK